MLPDFTPSPVRLAVMVTVHGVGGSAAKHVPPAVAGVPGS